MKIEDIISYIENEQKYNLESSVDQKGKSAAYCKGRCKACEDILAFIHKRQKMEIGAEPLPEEILLFRSDTSAGIKEYLNRQFVLTGSRLDINETIKLFMAAVK